MDCETKNEIIAIIKTFDGPFTSTMIANASSKTRSLIQWHLGTLVRAGQLTLMRPWKQRVAHTYLATETLGRAINKVKRDSIEPADLTIDNVFRAIAVYGHDEDFDDKIPDYGTSALCGSEDKIETMRRRVEQGLSPYHPDDETRIDPTKAEHQPNMGRMSEKQMIATSRHLVKKIIPSNW
jgi:hypothetical protein